MSTLRNLYVDNLGQWFANSYIASIDGGQYIYTSDSGNSNAEFHYDK